MSEFLESCHVCGHDIASEAESCRNCGAKANPVERLRLLAARLAAGDYARQEEVKRQEEQEYFSLVLIGAAMIGLLLLAIVFGMASARG